MRACLLLLSVLAAGTAIAETVKLPATADIWVSECGHEKLTSMGLSGRIKIKSIQEFGLIRFDPAAAKGRKVEKARLFLRKMDPNMLRYIRVSTVAANWEEGKTPNDYGPGNGSCYSFADFESKRPWAWPGSEICDVIMTSGNTLAAWAERKELKDGWISVEITPELVYAMVANDTDGLAVMDGGTLNLSNNFIHSMQSKGSEPYIEVDLGEALNAAPAAPVVKAEPCVEAAHMNSGALKLTIQEAPNVLCWRITLNGKPVERWRVTHPAKKGPTTIWLDDLTTDKCALEVVAVSPSGQASPPAKIDATAAPALSNTLQFSTFVAPTAGAAPPESDGKLRVFAVPGLVKLSPETGAAMMGDEAKDGDLRKANAVWNGKEINLFGGRGEYVSYQLCIEKLTDALTDVSVKPQELSGPGGKIGGAEIELYRNWYAKNGAKQFQPSHCIPLAAGATFNIPDGDRVPKQQNQTVYVDVYIPKDAKPGDYAGSISVEASGVKAVSLPVKLKVLNFTLPDKLSFWPELNAYSTPNNAVEYYKLAHQHRCVVNINNNTWAPKLSGAGKDIKADWEEFDKRVGPFFSGELFKANRRAGIPIECMYLPYGDSWPTPLTPQTYRYEGHWPGRGEKNDFINDHYLKAPYIGDALSQDYKDAFLAIERQYIQHFKEKNWTQTEMQCFFGGKNTHRTQYGANMWWTTDEPYHWDDWLALHYFNKLFTEGRGGADPKVWATRGDISRPNWEGRVMEGVLTTQYGGMGSNEGNKRMALIARNSGIKINNYGGANSDASSNLGSIAFLLGVWCSGGNAHLPWQTFGSADSLENCDAGAGGGNAILVPGDRFKLPVVADMRLKALRDGQQLIEYLKLLGDKHKLQREQINTMIQKAMKFTAGRKAGSNADTADAVEFSALQAWQISELRRNTAELILKGQ